MADFDTSLDSQRLEGRLTDQQMAARDCFVNEYMKDFDSFRACVRMGFMSSFAVDQAKAFMQDGYVLRKIDFMTRTDVAPGPEDLAAMLANLRWLAYNAPPATRAVATQRYMEARGYVAKAGDLDDARVAAIVNALAGFADSAPS